MRCWTHSYPYHACTLIALSADSFVLIVLETQTNVVALNVLLICQILTSLNADMILIVHRLRSILQRMTDWLWWWSPRPCYLDH